MSNVHWFTFEEISTPMPAPARPRQASRLATSTSGDSEASGASHWIRRNSETPNVLADVHESLRERLGRREDRHRR